MEPFLPVPNEEESHDVVQYYPDYSDTNYPDILIIQTNFPPVFPVRHRSNMETCEPTSKLEPHDDFYI